MTINDKIRPEKRKYGITKEAAKISGLSCEKMDKNENLSVEEILLPNRIQIIKKVKFMYTPLGKALETS